MLTTDPIADMLTRIRNALVAKHDTVDVPASNMKVAIAQILLDEGYIKDSSFDGRGNYALGVKEQLIFPEINYDDVDKVRGMDIVFVTTAKTDEEAKALLEGLGMPFAQA